MNCLVCGSPFVDMHHWKTRKSGGPDTDWNLMPLCRREHTEVHKIGTNRFVEKYAVVKRWLLDHGWNFNEVKKKWTRY